MFSKKKAVPALTRSRFTKAKPKIGPKSSQPSSKNEKTSEKTAKEEKNTELPSNPNLCNKTSVSDSIRSLDESADSPSVAHTKDSQNESISSQLLETEQESQLAQNTDLNTNDASSKRIESDLSREDSELYIDPSVATIPSPVKNSNFKEIVSRTENETPENTSNEELSTKAFEPEKDLLSISPLKSSSFNTTDKNLKYPCLTKILAAPKKRPQNKEVNERKKKMASYKELPPRSEMTFTDLIYWNPNTEPMKQKEKTRTFFISNENEDNPVEEEEKIEEGEEDDAVPAPKLFVNENGEIIIDESSLVVKRKKKAVDLTAEAIIMDDSDVTYSTFRRKICKKWSPKETVNFYKAVSVVGTDFALMENIMPNRTRRELKIKFKKEEKINTKLLHRAMYETDTFQTDLSAEDLDLEIIDIPGLEECIADDAIAASSKRKGRKRKTEVLSEIASNDAHNEKESLPVKKGRGRPKDKKNAFVGLTENSLPSMLGDIRSTGKESLHNEKKKRVTTLPRDSTLNCDNEVLVENGEPSPVVRQRRKTKILSQDSQENADEMCEIDVQITSLADEGTNQDFNGYVDTCFESMINPEESPTESEDHVISPLVKLQKLPIPKEIITEACYGDVNTEPIEVTKDSKSTPSVREGTLSPVSKSCNKHQKPGKIESATINAKVPYRRSRKLNVKPNVKALKTKCVDSQPTTTENEEIQDCVLIPSEGSTVISVSNDQLLSEGSTYVVTTPALPKRQRAKAAALTSKLSKADGQSDSNRVHFSSLNYTPVMEPEADQTPTTSFPILEFTLIEEPQFAKKPGLKTYSRTRSKRRIPEDDSSYNSQAQSSGRLTKDRSPPDNLEVESSTEVESHASQAQPCDTLNELLAQSKPSSTEDETPACINSQPSETAINLAQSDDSTLVVESPANELPVSFSAPVERSYRTYQAPLSTPELLAKNVNPSSSPLITSLNVSSNNRTMSIPCTPEMTDDTQSPVMVMKPSPDVKSFHFFVPSSFLEGEPLPPEILRPPDRSNKLEVE